MNTKKPTKKMLKLQNRKMRFYTDVLELLVSKRLELSYDPIKKELCDLLLQEAIKKKHDEIFICKIRKRIKHRIDE